MPDTVIIYASFAGTTRRVAEYLSEKLNADCFNLKVQSKINLGLYSKVILGTGVHAGRPYGKLVKFIEDNRAELNDKDVHLFINCIYKGERAEKQCSNISQNLGIQSSVYFSTKGEKNESGLSKDVDTFAERMSS